jgi:hypothetical protein
VVSSIIERIPRLPRRTFISLAALSAAAATPVSRAVLALGVHATDGVERIRVRPFPLSAVRLRAGAALAALEINRRHLMGLDIDRLLHMFRLTAGLPSTAQPLGGWEAPDNELRGHFTGHYLSACALLGAQTGDGAIRNRGTQLAAELAGCQAAIGTGYLSGPVRPVACRSARLGALLHPAQDHGGGATRCTGGSAGEPPRVTREPE